WRVRNLRCEPRRHEGIFCEVYKARWESVVACQREAFEYRRSRPVIQDVSVRDARRGIILKCLSRNSEAEFLGQGYEFPQRIAFKLFLLAGAGLRKSLRPTADH